jgi:hypothetical protein
MSSVFFLNQYSNTQSSDSHFKIVLSYVVLLRQYSPKKFEFPYMKHGELKNKPKRLHILFNWKSFASVCNLILWWFFLSTYSVGMVYTVALLKGFLSIFSSFELRCTVVILRPVQQNEGAGPESSGPLVLSVLAMSNHR